MREGILLVLAAVLEVSGDAMIRKGLARGGISMIVAGILVLGLYGLLVNLTRLDFSRLMGVYVVLFFLIAQVIAVYIFKERLHTSVIVGGLLILAGGITMTVCPK